uniref:Uncharacterized protein n=1 Tax=Accipiter nisus TaxID=211598 RepID=A0A8B9MYJ7_9AVES
RCESVSGAAFLTKMVPGRWLFGYHPRSGYAGGHWCPWPLAHLSPSTRPIPSAGGAAQHPPGSLAAPRTEPVLPEMSPSPRLGVWCWAPACRGVSQGFCFCLAEAVLLCFVCSQSVSFVSVFEKKIRSLPPPPPTRYQPGVTTAIVSLSDPDTRENSRSGTSGELWFPSLFSFQGHLCCGEVGQRIEPFPASQLASQFGGGGSEALGMRVSEERGCWAGQAAFPVPAGEDGDAAVSCAVI